MRKPTPQAHNEKYMTENDFRVKHSEIIEYYQLIEMRLKGICASLKTS